MLKKFTRIIDMMKGQPAFVYPVPKLSKDVIQWLINADIKIVDIGARGDSLPELDLIAGASHLFACEPDPVEAVRITPLLKSKWSQASVFSEALYSVDGEMFLNITRRNGLSSLLQPNKDIVTRYYPDDNIYSVTDTLKVKTIGLDTAASKYGFEDASFIKIDTQGTELDILNSGKSLLENSVIGIHTEVEFHEFYSGQSLFSEVDSFLRSLGFSLFDLEKRFLRRASYDETLYSRRQVVWGNALYLKEPSILAEKQDGETFLKQLKKLLAVALSFGYFDLVFEILNRIKPYESTDKISEEIKIYVSQITANYVFSGKSSVLQHGAKERKKH